MKLVVTSFVSLDGVVQAPGGPDEDRSGGFRHGGWAVPYFNDAMLAQIEGGMAVLDALLLGRRTYEIFAAHWPHLGDEDPVAARFNRIPKYVATHDAAPLAWKGSTRIGADLAREIADIRQQPGQEAQVHGSGTLVHSLLQLGVVDELRLWWFPVLLGAGKRLFDDQASASSFERVDHRVFDTGVVYQAYRKRGELDDYGYFGLEEPSPEELVRQRKIAEGKD